jgi:hypothetical protein
MAASHSSTDPKPLYAGRLRLEDEAALANTRATKAFDQKTNQKVLVAIETKAQGQQLAKLSSASHAHLNPVVDVVEQDEDWLVISRDLEAVSLSKRIAETGKKQPVDAVRMALRIADAISHLHELGLTHGRVHPDNVLVGLVDVVEPSLVFGSQCSEAYVRPERRKTAEPLDPRDDTWSATALLYFMLTGNTPPAEGLESTDSLESTPIDDPLLREVLLHGLAKSPEKRAKTPFALKRELARWFIAHAADEPISLATPSQKPPPLPASIAPVPRISMGTHALLTANSQAPQSLRSTPTQTPPKPVWLRSVPLAVGAAVVGITVAWGIALLRKGESTVILKDKVVPNANATASGPIDLAEVPVTGKEQQPGDATASCVRGYLRDGTLVKVPQLDSICKSSELPHGLGTLRQAFATTMGATAGNLPKFDTLGWYSVPTLAGLRLACCGDTPTPLKLPDLTDVCGDFAPAVEELARAIGSSQSSIDSMVRRFNEAAVCAAKSGRAAGISSAAPSPVSERAFRELFASTQPATDASASSSTAATAPRAP